MQNLKLICRFFSWLTVDETFFTPHVPRDLAVASSLTQLFLICFGKLGMQVERLNPHCCSTVMKSFSPGLFLIWKPPGQTGAPWIQLGIILQSAAE